MKASDYLEIPHEEMKKEIELWKSQRNNRDLQRVEKVAIENKIFRGLVAEFGKCAKCQRIDNLTLDHIVPLRLLADFGIDITRTIIDGNYQLLCKTCNLFKSGRLDFSTPETKKVLLTLLEKI